ncbi:MAG: Mrp/NBP35 family ATP-binding protein [Elusimicrobiota bacterium]
MPTTEEILKAMSKVQEPELGRDLVSLDMVKDIVIEGGKVSLKVELTTPACPLKEEIQRNCEAALKSVPGVTETGVVLTHRVLQQKAVPDKEPVPGVKNIIAVYACKGGVGKSTVATNLAASLVLDGCSVGLLDADIYGPNVPIMMGAKGGPEGDGDRLLPLQAHGVKLMSLGFLMRDDTPVIWRGPMVHGAVRQLLRDTSWGELDYLIVDLPPGTGDAQLTLIQTVPLAGVVAVTTPQDVALLDGIKGIQMFRKLNVPILGLVENMSGFECPHCHEETAIFSKGGGEREASRLKIPYLGAVPLHPDMVAAGDQGVPIVVGRPASAQAKALRWAAKVLAGQISIANMNAPTVIPIAAKA